jgi:hypothetical protein
MMGSIYVEGAWVWTLFAPFVEKTPNICGSVGWCSLDLCVEGEIRIGVLGFSVSPLKICVKPYFGTGNLGWYRFHRKVD